MEDPSGQLHLQSDTHRINTGSNQQLVTAGPNSSNTNNFWIIKESHDAQTSCATGTKIPFGQKIRLQHLDTKLNLHSHNYKSPLSNNQEVTAFGNEEGNGDNGDNWMIQPATTTRSTNEKYWMVNQPVLIQHVDTGKFLSSSRRHMFTQRNCGRGCPVMNHGEVAATNSRDHGLTWWKADLGIFLSV
jgi:dolichyl-phosphate-mannose--protein O-mannosyl transferase